MAKLVFNPFTSQLDYTGAGSSYTADGQGIELTGTIFSLELDSTTLSKSATGLKVATGGITNNEVAVAAAIDFSKLNSLAVDSSLIPDSDGPRSLGSTSNRWGATFVTELDDTTGAPVLIVPNRTLNSSNGFTSVDFQGRLLFASDPGEEGDIQALSANYQSRVLYAPGSTAMLSWGGTDISANSHKITDLAAPTVNGDALRFDQLGANNGIATLDGGGKIPTGQLPSSVMTYEGIWNASTNTPTLVDGTGDAGMVYLVTVAGTQDLGSGSQTFAIGDWVVANSSVVWQKSINSNAVVSVNSQTGVVTINAINQLTGDVTTSAASGSESKATTIAAGVVSATKLGTVTDGVTLDQGGAGSTLEIKTGGISNTQVNASAAITLTKLAATTASRALVSDGSGFISPSAVTSTELGYVSGVTSAIQTQINNLISTGDLNQTSFSAVNNQAAAANVTGLAFANASVRSFEAQVSVTILATGNLYEVFTLRGIQKDASWDLAQTSNGDTSGIVFTITSAGQVQYTSTNVSGFTSNTMKFRAKVLSV
jgi:hypothetical protein